MEESLQALAPRALLGWLDVEGVEFLHGSSFLGAPQGVQLLLVILIGWPILVPSCEHVGLHGLVPHNVVFLVGGRRHIVFFRLGALELALFPWDHVLGDDVIHITKGGLVNHCHEMGCVELDGLDDDANELGEDLHLKKCPKSVGLSGAILMIDDVVEEWLTIKP